MKLFTIRNIIGLAAIGGAYAYAKKHGGFKNAFDELMRKKDELLAEQRNKRMTSEPATTSTGYGTGSTGYERH